MRINPYQSIQHIYRQQVEKANVKKETRQKGDQVEISSEALEMQKGTPLEKARQEKVAELKKKIESGEYKVNAKAVAAKFYEFWNE